MPLDEDQRKTSLVVPILLITLGVLFLFKSWHPGFEPYQVLKTYWPLILILVGVGKIWDSSRRRAAGQASSGVALGSTVGVVAFVVVLVILLGHYQKSRGRFTRSDGESYARHTEQVVELGGAKSAAAT